MKRYSSMEKSVIYVSILTFIGVVALITCLGLTATSDDSIVANVRTETETIGVTLNTKNGFVLDTSLNNFTTIARADVDTMLTNRGLYNDGANDTRPDIISVNLPNVTSIVGAFLDCHSLTSVNLPNVNYLSNSAFSNCTSLTSVNFPKVTFNSDAGFSIGNDAFSNCTSLTSVNFPNAKVIGNDAFQNCTSLTSVNFPKLTTIGNEAFLDCTSLTSVNFPELTDISSDAFKKCFNLTSVNFPKVNSISAGAFFNCTDLITVKFPTTVTLTGTADNPVFLGCLRLGEGVSTLNINPASSFVIPSPNTTVGISQGRTPASYNTGVITFG